MSPKRDRNHELETESQRAFESALPPSLVVRPVSDDYGIDREVEVFVEGEATGLTFKVQLKGTDKSGKSRRIKREHLRYWQSLDVPVLLVSYESPSRRLRGRWVHSIVSGGPDDQAKTLTAHMDPDIDIDGKWPASLPNDLRVLRALKKGEVPIPTPMRVEVSRDAPLGGSPAELLTASLVASRRTSSPMRATRDETEAALLVRLDGARLRVILPLGMASCTYDLDLSSDETVEPRDLADLVLMSAAVAVKSLNSGLARQWLIGAKPTSFGWANLEFAEHFVPLLAASTVHVSLLLEVHATLVEGASPAADLYSLALSHIAPAASSVEFEHYSRRIQRQADANSDSRQSARLKFNLAQIHRQRKEFEPAATLLETISDNAWYRKDAMFHQALGGCQFELGRFDECSTSYQTALLLGYDAYELLPLLADSLMWAGRYGDARDAMARWSAEGSDRDRIGILREVAIEHILGFTGMVQQDRVDYDPESVQAAYDAAVARGGPTSVECRDFLVAADALNPTPWRHLAGLSSQDGGGADAAVLLALLLPGIAQTWTLALIRSLAEDRHESLLQAIVNQGRFHLGEKFYDDVWLAAGYQEKKEADVLRALISAAFSPEPGAFVGHLRFVDFANLRMTHTSVTRLINPRLVGPQ